MRSFFLIFLTYILSITSICGQEVIINVKFTSKPSAKISVFDVDMITGNHQLSSSNYDSLSKSYHLKFNINKSPLFAFIDLGYRNQKIYIKPNFKYELIINPVTDSVSFFGKDHVINNFFEQQQKFLQTYLSR